MDKPMEHLKQWHNQFNGVLTANETALYVHIFMMANRQFWPEWIRLTDSQLALGTNINVKRIPELINSLVQKKLIVSDRGKGKAPSKYNLCAFTKDGCLVPNYTQTGIINEAQNGKKTRDKREINERYTGDKREINERLAKNSPSESKSGDVPNTYTYTQHKESKKKVTKKQYAENVFLTEDEYSKLVKRLNGNTSAVSWCIEKLDNSKGAKGYTYKSDYRAILNWVIDDYVKKYGNPSSCQSDYPVQQGDDDYGLPEDVRYTG